MSQQYKTCIPLSDDFSYLTCQITYQCFVVQYLFSIPLPLNLNTLHPDEGGEEMKVEMK